MSGGEDSTHDETEYERGRRDTLLRYHGYRPPPWQLRECDAGWVHIMKGETPILWRLPLKIGRALVIEANKFCGLGCICPKCLMPNFHRQGGGPHFDNDWICPDCGHSEERR